MKQKLIIGVLVGFIVIAAAVILMTMMSQNGDIASVSLKTTLAPDDNGDLEGQAGAAETGTEEGIVIAYAERDDATKTLPIELAAVRFAERSKGYVFESVEIKNVEKPFHYYPMMIQKQADGTYSRGLVYTAIDPSNNRRAVYFKNITDDKAPVKIYTPGAGLNAVQPSVALGTSGTIYIAFGLKTEGVDTAVHDSILVYKMSPNGGGIAQVSSIQLKDLDLDIHEPAITSLGENATTKSDQIGVAFTAVKNTNPGACSAGASSRTIQFTRSNDAGKTWGARTVVQNVPCDLVYAEPSIRYMNAQTVAMAFTSRSTKDDTYPSQLNFMTFSPSGTSPSAVKSLVSSSNKSIKILRPRIVRAKDAWVIEYAKNADEVTNSKPVRATVLSKDNGVTWQKEVEITKVPLNATAISKVEITSTVTTVEVGKTIQFVAKAYDASNKEVQTTYSWSVSDTSIGKIGGDKGLFTALKKGTTDVTVTAGGKSAKVTVTVTEAGQSQGKCNEKGMDIADDKTKFDLADILTLETQYLSNASGKDINGDGSFSYADVVALIQCNVCKWDWTECQ